MRTTDEMQQAQRRLELKRKIKENAKSAFGESFANKLYDELEVKDMNHTQLMNVSFLVACIEAKKDLKILKKD